MDSDFWTDNNQDDARNKPETQAGYFLQSAQRVYCACALEEALHRLIYDWEMPSNKPVLGYPAPYDKMIKKYIAKQTRLGNAKLVVCNT